MINPHPFLWKLGPLLLKIIDLPLMGRHNWLYVRLFSFCFRYFLYFMLCVILSIGIFMYCFWSLSKYEPDP